MSASPTEVTAFVASHLSEEMREKLAAGLAEQMGDSDVELDTLEADQIVKDKEYFHLISKYILFYNSLARGLLESTDLQGDT